MSTAVITGASSDLGAAVVARLAQQGLSILATGRSEARLAVKLRRAVESGRCVTLPADLTDPASAHAIAKALPEGAGLDLLVLGSGIYDRSDDPDVLTRLMGANVVGPYALLQALRARLVAAKGLVVFLNSTQGLRAAAQVGQYAATQHALRALADSLRDEVNGLGVRVLTIYLGRTATERQQAIFASENRAYTPERLIQPDDVAQVIAAALMLPRTSEITEITMRPMLKPLDGV